MKPERRRYLLAASLCLLAGLAQALSLAWPGSGQPIWWLQLLALGLLGWQLEQLVLQQDIAASEPAQAFSARTFSAWRRGAWLGWLFATAWLAGTFWWLFISLHTYGGLPAWLAALAVLVLAGVLALYYAIACGVYVKLAPAHRALRALLFAALWLLAELARARWFTGFGWGGIGYAHIDGLLAGYAPWLGVFGLGAMAAWLAMTLPQAWACGPWQRVVALAVLVWPSVWQMEQAGEQGGYSLPAGRLEVALLQGNIPQDEKFQSGSGVPQALQWYGEQLRDSTASLVVAPETAIPLLPSQLPEGYMQAIAARFAQGQQAALLGQPLGSFSAGYSNSALGFKPAQQVPWRYDKHHLVPFGEFIPPFFRWFTELMHIPLGDFLGGSLAQPPFEWQGQRLGLNICYEDLFGEELALRFGDPARAPTIFVNLSNIAWFGDTVAIAQHLHITRMRALEFERPFLRATNTGATALVDHRGRVRAALPAYTRGVLRAEVEGRIGLTPYARWMSQLGLWPLWLAGLTIAGLAWAARVRAEKR